MRVKRRHARSVANSWDMRYRAKSEAGAAMEYLAGSLVNVGKGGICFETERELALGSQLDVELTSSGFPGPMLATGRAAWCRRSRVTALFEVGVEFRETSWDVQTKPEL